MKSKVLFYNSISPLMYQMTTIICGFILPRLILGHFGTEVNGLVNSITQFLGIIAFLELGVGAVVQSSLYKPLADNDNIAVSKVITSADKFFRRLGYVLAIYVIAMLFYYPYLVKQSFSFMFTATLIAAISIRSFAQYFFGIVNRLLLLADQKAYIQYIAQTAAVIANTVGCYILIAFDCSIQVVYGMTSCIFLLQPLVIHVYIKKHYRLNRSIKYDVEPIKQKWNGVAQHIASVVLNSVGIIVLTIFDKLDNVSIYSIYSLVVLGVLSLYVSLTQGIETLMGNLLAKEELEELKKVFGFLEWLVHNTSVLLFGCTACLIVPFVMIYTHGITDIDYRQTEFAYLFVFAYFFRAIRLPYNIMILIAGHYKQTQNNYIIATVINVVLTVVGVKIFGLKGAVLGTMIAMIYQLFYMVNYNTKNLLKIDGKRFLKYMMSDILIIIISLVISSFITIQCDGILEWIKLTTINVLIWLIVIIILNMLFFREYTYRVFNKIIFAINSGRME